jgi:hypothetical protein
VDLLDPITAFVLAVGEEIRSLPLATVHDDEIWIIAGRPSDLILLPSADPADDRQYVFVDEDGFRGMATLPEESD